MAKPVEWPVARAGLVSDTDFGLKQRFHEGSSMLPAHPALKRVNFVHHFRVGPNGLRLSGAHMRVGCSRGLGVRFIV